jgi:rhamnopyranosyl-N-acetylglucosaminyl-diphospho-decaprenol beta-1,3/1,4-galactofuranosyltransferase
MPEPSSDARRIIAVVVTYNRRDMVTRLVAALDAGSVVPDEVIVVDNASRDGTAEALEAAGTSTPLTVLRLTQNTGGAGGFHTGLAAAMDRGADLAWLMDDDGTPAADCLESLLPHIDTHDFIGPAVVSEDDPGRLCFPIRVPGSSKVLHAVPDLEAASSSGLLEGVLIPFNGVLVTRELVERIGLPREEFFIWGDDVEYLWRAQADGARIATVVGSRFRHPSTDDLGSPLMFGRTTYNHSPSDLKHYCMCRNNVVNLRAHRGLVGILAFVVKTLWFYLFTRRDLGRLRLSIEAMRAGWRGDFTGHRRFLDG